MYKIILSIILIVSFLRLNAQVHELVSSGGDYFQTSQLSISWSLGEPITETFTGSNIILTQGFQQGAMDLVGVPDGNRYSAFEIEAYPNPTEGKVFIRKNNSKDFGSETELNYSVFNLQGQLLKKGIIDTIDNSIDFSSFNQAAYLLLVTAKHQDYKAYIFITKL
jgi:hypothetical protein